MSGEPKWRVGDRVYFAHDQRAAYAVTSVQEFWHGFMVEIEGFGGLFSEGLFIAAAPQETTP